MSEVVWVAAQAGTWAMWAAADDGLYMQAAPVLAIPLVGYAEQEDDLELRRMGMPLVVKDRGRSADNDLSFGGSVGSVLLVPGFDMQDVVAGAQRLLKLLRAWHAATPWRGDEEGWHEFGETLAGWAKDPEGYVREHLPRLVARAE